MVHGQERKIGLIYCLFCLFVMGFFFVLLYLPPIITAAGYTIMAYVVYNVCHKTFIHERFSKSELGAFISAITCAAGWPFYFLFGFFFFLINITKRY